MRQLMPQFLLIMSFVFCHVAVAGDAVPIGTWSMGPGTVAGTSVQPQQVLLTEQMIASSNDAPARFNFHAPVAGHVTLRPGSALTIKIETRAEQQFLVMDIERGAVQIQLDNKATYAAMQVRGGTVDITVTGTLFVVERVRRDVDYVALIKGKLKVQLRKEVADALGKAQAFELDSRQGIGASGAGLTDPEALNNRPQIAEKGGEGVQEQGKAPKEGDGGWDDDKALDLLLKLLEGVDDEEGAQIIDSLGDSLFGDLHAGPGEQVLNTVFTAPGALALPPPPPPF